MQVKYSPDAIVTSQRAPRRGRGPSFTVYPRQEGPGEQRETRTVLRNGSPSPREPGAGARLPALPAAPPSLHPSRERAARSLYVSPGTAEGRGDARPGAPTWLLRPAISAPGAPARPPGAPAPAAPSPQLPLERQEAAAVGGGDADGHLQHRQVFLVLHLVPAPLAGRAPPPPPPPQAQPLQAPHRSALGHALPPPPCVARAPAPAAAVVRAGRSRRRRRRRAWPAAPAARTAPSIPASRGPRGAHPARGAAARLSGRPIPRRAGRAAPPTHPLAPARLRRPQFPSR